MHKSLDIESSRALGATADDHQILAKVAWRIIPFLFLCYVVSFLDRINIGFAQLQMKHDLGFSDAMYGLGAAVFYIGYVLCEVTNNTRNVLGNPPENPALSRLRDPHGYERTGDPARARQRAFSWP